MNGQPLTAVVVDDEQLAREELCFLLGQLDGVEVVGQATNGMEAVEAIARLDPDVAFLDIQMPGLTGFEVVRQLHEAGTTAAIVFVTAFDQHAVEAFEVNAVDYLLKPVEAARLAQAVHRARARRPDAVPLADQLDRLVRLMATANRPTQVAVKVGERFVLRSGRRDPLRLAGRRFDHRCDRAGVRHVERPDPRRVAGETRPGRLLAGAPFASRQYQQDQGDRPLVQQELHPQDEGREGDGDPGQPVADAATPGVPEAVAFADPGDEDSRLPGSSSRPSRRSRRCRCPRPSSRRPGPEPSGLRLDVWRDEFVAWVKTLASAAVYATLIVTFGFQVARVEGQSMAPTLADQDRLIVNKLRLPARAIRSAATS